MLQFENVDKILARFCKEFQCVEHCNSNLVEETRFVILSQLSMCLQHSKGLQHCDVIVGVHGFASLVEDALEEGEAEAEGRCEEGGGSRVEMELFDGAF